MRSASAQAAELARLSELIDHIYQGATEPSRWNEIVPQISDWVNAKCALLFTPMHAPDNGGFYFNHAIPESVMHLWATRWKGEDIMVNTAVQRGMIVEGGTCIGEDIVPFEQVQQTPMHLELNHPNGIDHMLFGAIFGPTSPIGLPTIFSFYRSVQEGPFLPQERERLNILLPHISRSFGVMAKLKAAEIKVTSHLSALDRLTNGVLLFGKRGQVLFANRAARRILEEEDGLRLRHLSNDSSLGELIAKNAGTRNELANAITHAISPDILHTEHFSRAVLVPRPSGRQAYTINFSTLAEKNEFVSGDDMPRAIAFITDSADPIKLDADLFKKTYGLTPAEIRLAETIAECLTVDESAERLNLSSHTVRTQLKSIYLKTNTNNRAKLMRLIMSLTQTTR